MSVSPFRIDIPDEVLDDLRARLRRTRFASASDARPWAAGVDPGYLRSLVAHWADGFDWRAAEAALNRLPQYRADVGGQRVHFVHLRASGRALPLVLTHGWPSSIVEMLPLVPLLSDAFDLVIPSLPGFGFSDLPPDGPVTRKSIAETWHRLMTDVLGYRRYGAHGGDIGAGVTNWLGGLYPESVAGIHVIHPGLPAGLDDLPAAEREFLNALDAYDERDGGYSAIMATRPDTIAAALHDSPAGLAAWIVDKYRDWCDGDLETRFRRDDLLTIITLYWATGTVGSSFRQYYDWEPTPPPMVRAPAAVTMSAEPVFRDMPRSLAERGYADLRQWRGPTAGGHFMAMEEPEMLARDLKDFFRNGSP